MVDVSGILADMGKRHHQAMECADRASKSLHLALSTQGEAREEAIRQALAEIDSSMTAIASSCHLSLALIQLIKAGAES